MYLYFKIDPVNHEIIDMLDLNNRPEGYVTKEISETNGKPYLVPAIRVKEVFDSSTHKLGDWINSYDPETGEATRKRAVVPKDAEQIAREQEIEQDRQDKQAVVTEPVIKQLITARPAQIDTYIDNNVTDLASAKNVLKILAKAISAIGKEAFK